MSLRSAALYNLADRKHDVVGAGSDDAAKYRFMHRVSERLLTRR